MKKQMIGIGVLAMLVAIVVLFQILWQELPTGKTVPAQQNIRTEDAVEISTEVPTEMATEVTIEIPSLVVEDGDIVIKETPAEKKFLVCLDPGHGGIDPGSNTGKEYEKDQVLELAILVKDILQAEGVDAFLTRKDDTTWYLEDRVNYANGNHADVLVSIHRNYCENWIVVNGIEAWIHSTQPQESVDLATFILDRMEEVGKMDIRGIKSGSSDNPNENYTINRNSEMPSLILEVGYMSDRRDNEAFDYNKKEYAQAIALGILDYMEKYN